MTQRIKTEQSIDKNWFDNKFLFSSPEFNEMLTFFFYDSPSDVSCKSWWRCENRRIRPWIRPWSGSIDDDSRSITWRKVQRWNWCRGLSCSWKEAWRSCNQDLLPRDSEQRRFRWPFDREPSRQLFFDKFRRWTFAQPSLLVTISKLWQHFVGEANVPHFREHRLLDCARDFPPSMKFPV